VSVTKESLARGNPPKDDYDDYLLEHAAVASVLMTECDDRLAGLSESQADLAKIGWQTQKEIEAGDLAQQLKRHPHRVSRKLQQTPQGCQYLILLWRVAQAMLLKQGELTPELHERILDLLGTPPELRMAGLTELDGPPGDATSPACRAQAIIERELARLRTLVDSPELQGVCEKARLRTIEGTEPWKGSEARLIIRYRSQHARELQWCLSELKRRRKEREQRARTIALIQRMEAGIIRRAHQDPNLPPDIRAILPDPPPPEPKRAAAPKAPAAETATATTPDSPKPPRSQDQQKAPDRMQNDPEERERSGSTQRG
jgi:hypothetical protein